MKNLIVGLMLVCGLATVAQEKIDRERLTAAQRTELQVKKMTLDLGLSEAQQKEMTKIVGEQNSKRDAAKKERSAMKDAGKRPTADERFAMQSKMLDEQIAMKERIKKILTPEQFSKWEEKREHKRIATKKQWRERTHGKQGDRRK